MSRGFLLPAFSVIWLASAGAHAAASQQAQSPAPSPDDALPAGEGRDILEDSCTSCHELDEVVNLKDKLTRDEWLELVKRMTDYGAQLDPKKVDPLVEYLDRNLGKRS